MDLELEDLKGYEGLYKINRVGQVWSIKRETFLKQPFNDGYYKIELYKESKRFYTSTHRLLAIQFIPNPFNLPKVDHIDMNRTNNSLENLRWVNNRLNCLNRTIKSKSGEQNIYKSSCNTYMFRIKGNNLKHCKYFKTIEEAKTYRDTYLRENNIN